MSIPAVNDINIEPTIGSFFLAAIASVGLLGLMSLQCWRYFMTFSFDPWFLKIIVLTLWALEFVKSTFAIHGCYFIAVKNWGNVAALSQPTWSMRSVLLFTTTIILIAHLFFIHKIWLLLLKKSLFPIILVAASFLGFAVGIAAYALAISATGYLEFVIIDRLTVAALACALVIDWIITVSLVIILRRHRSNFGQLGTNQMIKKLTSYVIETGLLTSLADLVTLILLNIDFKPYALYSISVYEVVGNLYANSVLACLNARTFVTSELATSEGHSRSIRFHHSEIGSDSLGHELHSMGPETTRSDMRWLHS